MRNSPVITRVDCHDFMQQVDVFIDGELDIIEHAAMEEHSRVCVSCNEKEARRRDTRQRLRESTKAFAPSDDFMARLQASLASAAEASEASHDGVSVSNASVVPVAPEPELLPTMRTPFASFVSKNWQWLGIAAAAVLVSVVGLRAIGTWGSDGEATSVVAGIASFASPVVGESVAWHRRNVPVEVVGPDARSVRSWFADKVSFAVNPPAFGSSARLLGGRLSHVREYEAAYLIYEVDGSKLTTMLFNAKDIPNDLGLTEHTFIDNSNGYNVAIRERDGVIYTFTTDLNVDELGVLVDTAMNH